MQNTSSRRLSTHYLANFQVPEEPAAEDHENEPIDYNNNAGILNSREAGQIHHLIPPAKQTCEVDDPIASEDKLLLDEPVILGYCSMVGLKLKL